MPARRLFLYIILSAISASFYVLAAQTNDSVLVRYDTVYSKIDTVYQEVVEEVITTDTIKTYWKLDYSAQFSPLNTFYNPLGNIPGFCSELNINFIRNNLYFRGGIGYSIFDKNDFYNVQDTTYPLFLREVDTTITIQELINGNLVETEIQTTLSFLDSTQQINTNKYPTNDLFKHITIPFTVGYIIDKGNFSMLNGLGGKISILSLNYRSESLMHFLEVNSINKSDIRRVYLNIFLHNQSLYYVSSSLALGTNIQLGYNVNSWLKTVDQERKFTWMAGFCISYVL